MENLRIRNFLIIKKADVDVKKMTLFIGPQANGKSIIAKLLYFFREFISTTYLGSVRNFENKRQLEKKGKSDFEQCFPKYAWTDQNFEIIYRNHDIEVSIIHRKNKKGNATKLDFSKDLAVLHRKLKSIYRKREAEYHEEKRTRFTNRPSDILGDIVKEHVFDSR
ncbi:MAG: AAA family ATPase, partial [Bacteroidetes bacterium]|nr:AAA family ATPase [Bacteroidota bacterium]